MTLYLEINGEFNCNSTSSNRKAFDLQINTEIKNEKVTYTVKRTYSSDNITSFSILAIGQYFAHSDGFSRYATATKSSFALTEKDKKGGATTVNFRLSSDGNTLYAEGFAGMLVNGSAVVMKTDAICSRQ